MAKPPNTLCLNRTTERNMTSELKALALSLQGERPGLISPHTSFSPCKARSSCVPLVLLRGRYVTALIVQWRIPHRRIREDGHLQPHIPRHQQGRVFIPFPWMSRYSECPWRCGNRGLDTLPSCPIAALGLPEGSLHGCTSTKVEESSTWLKR